MYRRLLQGPTYSAVWSYSYPVSYAWYPDRFHPVEGKNPPRKGSDPHLQKSFSLSPHQSFPPHPVWLPWQTVRKNRICQQWAARSASFCRWRENASGGYLYSDRGKTLHRIFRRITAGSLHHRDHNLIYDRFILFCYIDIYYKSIVYIIKWGYERYENRYDRGDRDSHVWFRNRHHTCQRWSGVYSRW
mgnify:CR=1 FL=1